MHTVHFASPISTKKQLLRKRSVIPLVRVLIQLLTRGDVHRVLAVRAIGGAALPRAEALRFRLIKGSHFEGR